MFAKNAEEFCCMPHYVDHIRENDAIVNSEIFGHIYVELVF